MLLPIDKFTEEQQRAIYECECCEHEQFVSDYFGEDVISMIVGKVTNEPKWCLLDVALTDRKEREAFVFVCAGSSDQAIRRFHQRAVAYWDYDYVLSDVHMDLDGLDCKQHDHKRLDLLQEHAGLTLPEALVALQLLISDRITFVKESPSYTCRMSVCEIDFEYDDRVDEADLSHAARDLLELAINDGMAPIGEVDAPMYAGSNPIKEVYLTSYEVIESNMFYGPRDLLEFKDSDVDVLAGVLDGILSKLYDYFHSFLSELASELQEEWDYLTSFEAWVEHVNCNEVEFDPNKYDITIEENANV